MPFVTIIIPYKSNLKYLFFALRSIFKQSYKNFKILIIYDDVKKNDLEKIKKFLKKKQYLKFDVKIIINDKNKGAGLSRNIGLKKSKTKYVAFLDSDDIWAKNKLQIQIRFMEKNNLLFSHSSYNIIDSKNKIISQRKAKKKIFFNDLIKSCDIGLSTVVLNLNFIVKNKLFFPQIKTKEDYILWLKIIDKIKIIRGINVKLSSYRRTKNSLSSNKLMGLINGYKVYKEYMNYGSIKSIFYLTLLSLNFIKKNNLSLNFLKNIFVCAFCRVDKSNYKKNYKSNHKHN